jgi:hypothetical protein
MHGFRRGRRGIQARFSERERALLTQLFGQLDELLDPGGPANAPAEHEGQADPLEALVGLTSTAAERPSDPALARLLPDGYADDEQASSEFRRYTESDLRTGKRDAAGAVLAGLRESGDGPVRLDEDTARLWLGALNDVRLVLGTRLGVTEQTYEELGHLRHDDPRYGPLAAYDWLTYLQETLVRALARW